MRNSREGASFFYDYKFNTNEKQHAIAKNLSLLAKCGISTPENFDDLDFSLKKNTKLPFAQLIGKKFIALHPFSRGKAKQLPPQCIATLIAEIIKSKKICVLVGKFDSDLSFINRFQSEENFVNLCNQTSFSNLINIFQKANFVISSDSGPAHLAGAVNQNCISIHHWTNPTKVGLWNDNSYTWKAHEIHKVSEIPLHLKTENRKLADEKFKNFIDTNDCKKIAQLACT